MTEPIVPYLQKRLKSVGSRRWEAIADRCRPKVAHSFIEKLVYGARDNPRVQTVQPLIDYFAKVDLGIEKLPEPKVPERQ